MVGTASLLVNVLMIDKQNDDGEDYRLARLLAARGNRVETYGNIMKRSQNEVGIAPLPECCPLPRSLMVSERPIVD